MHKQLYRASNYLGIGGLLLSVAIGGTQLFFKAQSQHDTDRATQQLESQAQLAEKEAELKSREMEAYRKGDTPKYDRLIATDRSRDEPAPTGYLREHLIALNKQILLLDKYDHFWGIWKPRKGFTKDFNVCNDPNSPLLKDK